MKANYHNNSYIWKARHKALLKILTEAVERRKGEQLFSELIRASVIAILNNWSTAKPANHEKSTGTILKIIKQNYNHEHCKRKIQYQPDQYAPSNANQ